MALSEERKNYIRELSNDEWIKPSLDLSDEEFDAMCEEKEEEIIDFVNETTNPEELHYFAETWNWDGGFEALQMLLNNPSCDRGTALMIYWLAQPVFYYQQYADLSQVPPDHEDEYDFIDEIENWLLGNSFETNQIQFIPTPEIIGCYELANYPYARLIPEELLQANC